MTPDEVFKAIQTAETQYVALEITWDEFRAAVLDALGQERVEVKK